MNRPKPKRLVLLGDPVAHSLSPAFQNAALRAAGIELVYEALRVPTADLPAAIRRLAAENAAGNVTVPHKREMLALCSRASPIAERVGAVNTFWTDQGEVVGDNTDVAGFERAVRPLLSGLDRLAVTVVGAGGSAAAVIGALERRAHTAIRIVARRPKRAEELRLRFGDVVRIETSIREAVAGANLIINATPVGMTDDSLPFPLDALDKGARVMDLVYRKGGTALVRAARARGIDAQDGIEMLLEQGALSFERWFGFPPDREVMRSAIA